jgi:hypothetical protein
MSYTNIVFVKLLWKELLHEDDRFVERLDDSQKGLYLMLLLLAGATNNNIQNSPEYLKRVLNLQENTKKIAENMDKILEVFPKLKVDGDFLKFSKFKKLHNYIRKSSGLPKGDTKDTLDKDKNRIDKDILRDLFFYFLKTKKIDIPSDYFPLLARYGKPLKELYHLSNNDPEEVKKVIDWGQKEYGGKGWTSWGIEALVKNYTTYMLSKNTATINPMGIDITKVKMYGM